MGSERGLSLGVLPKQPSWGTTNARCLRESAAAPFPTLYPTWFASFLIVPSEGEGGQGGKVLIKLHVEKGSRKSFSGLTFMGFPLHPWALVYLKSPNKNQEAHSDPEPLSRSSPIQGCLEKKPQEAGKPKEVKSCWRPTVNSYRKEQMKITWGTSLVVQWLRLHTSNAEGIGSIPGEGTKIPL